jgi:hypothetical protein
MLPGIDRSAHSTRQGRGTDLPGKRGSTKKAGVPTIEEYIQRRRETIMKYAETRKIYRSSRKIASPTYFGGKLIHFFSCNYVHERVLDYSDDAAGALTSRAPDG